MNNKSFYFLFFIVFILSSCIKHKPQSNAQITDKIKGKWVLGREEMYHTLHFIDEELWVENHIDTVFEFYYEINQDTLFLYDFKTKKLLYTNLIAKLDEDSLVFYNFMEKSGEQAYAPLEKDNKPQ